MDKFVETLNGGSCANKSIVMNYYDGNVVTTFWHYALSTLISAMRVYASKGVRIRNAFERHWKGLLDDCIADRHPHLDRGGCYEALNSNVRR